MNGLLAHLKSNIRAQWLSFTAIAALFILSSVACALYMPPERLKSTSFVIMFTLSMAMISGGVLAADSMAIELRDKHTRFLERLPGGRSVSLIAKGLVVSVGTVTVAVLGLVISNWIRMEGTGAAWFDLAADLDTRLSLPIVPSIATFVVTVMAVSVWVPRTLLSIPLAMLVLGSVILPIREGLRLSPDTWYAVPGTLYAAPLFGILAAWFGYVRGRRFGGGTFAATWRGGSVLAVGVVASLTWYADQWFAYSRFDVSGEYQVNETVRGTGGRFLYLQVVQSTDRRWRRSFVLQVDTASGAIEQIGSAGAEFDTEVDVGGYGVHRIDVISPSDPRQSFQIDTWTGEAFDTSQSDEFVESVPDVLAWRDSYLQMPGKGKAWVKQGKLNIMRDDGEREVHAWDASDDRWKPAGFGVHWIVKGRVFDFIRGRNYDSRITQSAAIWVLESGWLVASRRGDTFFEGGTRQGSIDYYVPGIGWTMYDPDTRQHRPANCLRDGDRVCDVLADGRVLVMDSSRRLFVIGVESGDRQLLFERSCSPFIGTERLANGDLLLELAELESNRHIASHVPSRSVQSVTRSRYRLSLGGRTLGPLLSPRLLGGMCDVNGNLIRESGEKMNFRIEIVGRRTGDARQIFPSR